MQGSSDLCWAKVVAWTDIVPTTIGDTDVTIGDTDVSNIWCAKFKLHSQRKLVDETDKVTVFFKFTQPHTLLADARTALRKMYGDDVATDATPLELSAWPKLKQS